MVEVMPLPSATTGFALVQELPGADDVIKPPLVAGLGDPAEVEAFQGLGLGVLGTASRQCLRLGLLLPRSHCVATPMKPRKTATTRLAAKPALTGSRRHHRQSHSALLTRRARIGRLSRNRRRSSARSNAVA